MVVIVGFQSNLKENKCQLDFLDFKYFIDVLLWLETTETRLWISPVQVSSLLQNLKLKQKIAYLLDVS